MAVGRCRSLKYRRHVEYLALPQGCGTRCRHGAARNGGAMTPVPAQHGLFRIAHVFDTHVLSPSGVEWRRVLFNKRITGLVNLVLHRARAYRREYLDAVVSVPPCRSTTWW
jgi:hypothetical protein